MDVGKAPNKGKITGKGWIGSESLESRRRDLFLELVSPEWWSLRQRPPSLIVEGTKSRYKKA